MDDIDYSHGDSGNKPPDGNDFQNGEAADPQEFDWYISTIFEKVNEVIANHVNDTTGVHGLSSNDSVASENAFTNHANTSDAHHVQPSQTQKSGSDTEVLFKSTTLDTSENLEIFIRDVASGVRLETPNNDHILTAYDADGNEITSGEDSISFSEQMVQKATIDNNGPTEPFDIYVTLHPLPTHDHSI